VSDVDLCAAFDRLKSPDRIVEYLIEMARRKGPVIVNYLSQKHKEVLEGHAKVDPQDSRSQLANLELLTTLRRAQAKPDPLQIDVGEAEEIETIFPRSPTIKVSLVNRDFEKKPVGFKEGGDYRSGRQERWRFDVRDAKGNPVPVKPTAGTRGGIYVHGTLKFGESWDTVLNTQRFIDLRPGDYVVFIEYHDYQEIASIPNTAGLIVCRSEPFKLHVQPRVIDVTRQDREATKVALASLDEKGRVLILEGTYTKADHDFIKPTSGAGRILTQGWKAVPSLLDELNDPKLTPRRRAWVLGLLFSITSWHDPQDEDDVLPSYESRSASWVVPGSVGGIGLGGSVQVSRDKIDEAKQKEFADRWKSFREYVIVREKAP
jgi:hypothetical protein